MLDSEMDLYLELLKGCLSRSIFGESYKPLTRPRKITFKTWPWWNMVYPLARKSLRLLDVEMVRKAHFDSEACRVGSYYHSEAESMIGLTGLDNVQRCAVDCLRRGVPGDFLEAGVWRGGTAILMRAILKVFGDRDRVIWLADSFRGCPKPQTPNERQDKHWENDFLAVSLDEVEKNFSKYGLLDSQVRFLPGWFSDVLPNSPVENLAILRIDADMYSSTMDALENLYSKVSSGGYVIIDDYFTIESCRNAVDEFRNSRQITAKMEPVDQCRVYWRVD